MADDYTNGVEENPNIIPFPMPSEVAAIPKFQLEIDSEGHVKLTIRTDDEEELQNLLDTWEPIIIPDFEGVQGNKVVAIRNGHDKQRYYPGDQCPQCQNKLIRKRSRNGVFLGCRGWPDCNFAQSL